MNIKFINERQDETDRAYKKKKLIFVILWAFLAAELLFFIADKIDSFQFSTFTDNNLFMVFLAIVALILLLVIGFKKKETSPNEYTKLTYTFFEDYTLSELQSVNHNEAEKAKYGIYYKIIEKRKYYLLYTDNLTFIILQKDTIVQGSIKELNELLKLQLNKRFVPLKK